MKGLPARIQELRENLNLAQKELADKIGVSRSTLASWESGHRRPELSHVEKLAALGHVSVDWLLGRTDDTQGVARATPPDEQAGDELVVMFRGKRQKLTPEYQRMLIKLMEAAAEDEAEKAKKSQP